jgi:LysR family transcriptional regulator for metE and metH
MIMLNKNQDHCSAKNLPSLIFAYYMSMEIRYLKLVKAIVEEGSIANAIDKLHLTPSALSHQLREAELQLGTPIFHRINKKMILTEAGDKVLASATIILKELEKVQREIKDIISGETGVIRISTECYTSYHWIPALLKKFHGEFPNIEVRIVFEATHKPIQKLLQGHIDLAITSDPVVANQVEYIELFQDEMFALVSESHAWADKPYVIAADFKDVNLIIHSEPLETVTIYERVLKPENIQPKNIIILPLTEASVEMVKADMGVIVMPRWALKPHLNSNQVKAIKVTPAGLHRQQYIARLQYENRPEYIDYFISFLRQEIEI